MTTSTESIGRYELLAEIGRGDMGVVYQGYDPETDRVVAIKIIPLANIPQTDPFQFFLEARATKRLAHPGIVCLLDVGISTEKQMLYLVREYVAGITLETMLQNGTVAPETALHLAKEIAEALEFAHREGFVHGNVQPYNILVTEEGHAKLGEFSAAKLGRAIHGDSAFLAPEQVSGGAPDARSDLFSLGAVLYAMLTGHVPFHGRGTGGVNWNAHRRAVSMANNGALAVPPTVDELLVKALANDPAERFQVARQMAFALQQALDPAPAAPGVDASAIEKAAEEIDGPNQGTDQAVAEEETDDIILEFPPRFLRNKPILLYSSAACVVLIAILLGLAAGNDAAKKRIKTHMPQFVKTSGAAKPSAGVSRANRTKKTADANPTKQGSSGAPAKNGNDAPASAATPAM